MEWTRVGGGDVVMGSAVVRRERCGRSEDWHGRCGEVGWGGGVKRNND